MNLQRNSGAILLLALLAIISVPTLAESPNTVAALAARINAERVPKGLAPFSLNGDLSAAAQAHADDIAATGKYGHTGSDGSTVSVRVARTNYGSYSWGRRVGENYAVYHGIDAAMGFWLTSPPHRANLFHTVYREIGIGIAPTKQWGATVYVLVFGAQPNVLPVFINEGAGSTSSRDVTLTLSSEGALPSGEGSSIGKPDQVQISNSSDVAGAPWLPFGVHLAWTLAAGNGTKTVYVKYRDVHGRTATSSDSIVLGPGDGADDLIVSTRIPATKAPAARPSATRTLRPTASISRTPRPAATATETQTPARTESPTAEATPTSTELPESLPATQALPSVSPSQVILVAYSAIETPAASTADNDAEDKGQTMPWESLLGASLLAIALGLVASVIARRSQQDA